MSQSVMFIKRGQHEKKILVTLNALCTASPLPTRADFHKNS